MRRLFWLVMGITIGALVVRKLSRAAEKLTPRGIAASLGGGLTELGESVREFSADVRAAMNTRETQLRAGAGFDGDLGKATKARPSAPTTSEPANADPGGNHTP
jgi:chromosome condensin MukBEF MukE localization factor